MKISVSNIAWYQDPKKITNFLEFISSLNCNGVELAPSAIWSEPIDSSKQDRDSLKRQIANFNLNFLGFHSLLYSARHPIPKDFALYLGVAQLFLAH